MSQARTDLILRVKTLKDCLAESAVADGAPTDLTKNQIACMFRNGLAVLVFACIEAYVRDRTAEVLRSISNAVLFSELSDKLQQATTIGAIKALLYRKKFETDAVAWALSQLGPIANAATNVSALSPLSFGQDKSNIAQEDIGAILSAFGIDSGWIAISSIAKRIGLGGTSDYKQSFDNLATRRHLAAHDITANIPLTDLENSINEIIGICCAFDLLLSHSLSLHNLKQIPNRASPVRHEQVKLRFISAHPKRVGAFTESCERKGSSVGLRYTLRTHSSLAAAETSALNSAKAKREQLIYLDNKAIPNRWVTW